MRNHLQQNVLISDSGRALLCDFGLARVKADITSRTTTAGAAAVAGSRHWMAPERLKGRQLRKPCDIYAFSMTVYEVNLILGETKSAQWNSIALLDLYRRDSTRLYQS